MTAGVKMNRTDKLIRIGVIADTHGLFDPEIIRYFKGVDHIIHAGDIGSRSVIECLEGIAPVTAVSGNVDEFETSGWPRESMFIHDGVRVAVRHVLYERGRLTKDAEVWLNRTRPAVCVFGHSHRPTIGRSGGFWRRKRLVSRPPLFGRHD